jgi:hypothetical protein
MSAEVKWDNTKAIITALDSFVEKVNEMYLNYRNKRFPDEKFEEKISYKVKSKYIRVTHTMPNDQTMVFCFIDSTNGNVLKANSWKSPDLKNPRGNLFSDKGGLEAVTTTHMGNSHYHPHIRYLR